MFYLRAVEEDINTTTPGLRKYFSDKKFKRLYEENLLDNLNKILNLWIVINKREILEDEKWSGNFEILKLLDILSAYPNEFWKYPVTIFYLKNSQMDSFETDFLSFLKRILTFLLVKYLQVPTINAVKNIILKLNAEIIHTSTPTFISLNINNAEFKQSIKMPPKNTVRMLLKIMSYQEKEQKELLPEKWEIEHIFPQKWHNNYFNNQEKSDEEIKEQIEHLGNKIPLEKKLNIEAGNGYFGRKKENYQKSNIQLVKKMGQIPAEDFTLEDIDARDEEIANMIQNLFLKWSEEYDLQNSLKVSNKPSEEDLKKIEEFRAKGWL